MITAAIITARNHPRGTKPLIERTHFWWPDGYPAWWPRRRAHRSVSASRARHPVTHCHRWVPDAELVPDPFDLEPAPNPGRLLHDHGLEPFEHTGQDRLPALEAFDPGGFRCRESRPKGAFRLSRRGCSGRSSLRKRSCQLRRYCECDPQQGSGSIPAARSSDRWRRIRVPSMDHQGRGGAVVRPGDLRVAGASLGKGRSVSGLARREH